MAATPTSPRDPTPLLARIPAGPVHDSIRLLWDQLNALKGNVAAGTPIIEVVTGVAVSIANNTYTLMPWDTVAFANDLGKPIANLVTFPERLTFPRDVPPKSVWLVTLAIQWDTNAAGVRTIEILYNDNSGGTSVAASAVDGVAGVPTDQPLAFVLADPDPGTYLTARVFQNSGGPLNVNTAPTLFTLTRLF